MPLKSAGLPLSVGPASTPLRGLIALVFIAVGSLCIAAGRMMSRDAPGAAIAILAIVPLGLIAFIAAAFVLAPSSRFGVWLDHFLGELTPLRALLTALAVWAASAIVAS